VIEKVISGGQTGADRAALDFAIAHGIPYGGWCPAGRLAEDGTIDARYILKETPSASYPQRTEWNVRDCRKAFVSTNRHTALTTDSSAEFVGRRYPSSIPV